MTQNDQHIKLIIVLDPMCDMVGMVSLVGLLLNCVHVLHNPQTQCQGPASRSPMTPRQPWAKLGAPFGENRNTYKPVFWQHQPIWIFSNETLGPLHGMLLRAILRKMDLPNAVEVSGKIPKVHCVDTNTALPCGCGVWKRRWGVPQRQRGFRGGSGTQKFVSQKWPKEIFPNGTFHFSPLRSGGEGGPGGGGVCTRPWWLALLACGSAISPLNLLL